MGEPTFGIPSKRFPFSGEPAVFVRELFYFYQKQGQEFLCKLQRFKDFEMILSIYIYMYDGPLRTI